MKVISTNTGEKRHILWLGKELETGIYKSPHNRGIFLEESGVKGDHIGNPESHGGKDKACYLFSADIYPHFQKIHQRLEWDWGMFGENLTIEELDESEIMIGSQYQIGEAIVEVSEPRQPCFKLGVRFGTQKILKQFIVADKPGVYVRVLQSGLVRPEDKMELLTIGSAISISDIHQLMYGRHENPDLISSALALEKLAESTKEDLRRRLT